MSDKKTFYTLAFESSCDETSVAVLEGGRTVKSNITASQIDIHKRYGGVVPEIASRHHLENINTVIDSALGEANIKLEDINLIAVTYGPGLVGALLVGVATAKAVAMSMNIPIVGVHHIEGHICANYIENHNLEPPFISLVVSGGHTNIVRVKSYTEYEILGETRDDAVGEAYDKVARVLGLDYPGGPLLDKLAKEGDPDKVFFKRVMLEKDSSDFSFSGTKTGVLNYLNSEKIKGNKINKADVAAGFQEAVVDVIVEKTMAALVRFKQEKVAIAGGVAANSRLREKLEESCKKYGVKLYKPSPVYCTDNAAMIGVRGYYGYMKGEKSPLTLDAVANLKIGTKEEDCFI